MTLANANANYPLTETLGRTLQELSQHRDQQEQNITEQRMIQLEDGSYAHEVVTRTTPRRRPDTGEEVSTVTRRRVSSSALEDPNAPPFGGGLHLTLSTKRVTDISPLPAHTPITTSAAGAANNTGSAYYDSRSSSSASRSIYGQAPGYAASPSPPPGAGFIATNPQGLAGSSHGTGNWHYTGVSAAPPPATGNSQGHFRREPQYYDSGNVASPNGINRGVAWGQTRTTVFEPSRISPLHPQGNYAPLKYLTRRELRAMRERSGQQRGALANRIRASSVPRLDDLMEEEERDRRAMRVAGNPGTREFYDPDALDEVPAGTSFSSTAAQYGGSAAAMQQRRPSNSGSRQGSSQRSSSAQSVHRIVPMPAVDGDEYVARFAATLAAVRSVQRYDDPPAYAGAAMQLLLRGTYLIHYGRTPHERFFMLRILADDYGRQMPYLVWSLHADSATYMDKIPLPHLAGMGRGTSTARFRRFQVDARSLRGPFVGDESSIVPATFAFAFVFKTRTSQRTVEVLALDDQTYRCWLLVLDYFAGINAGGNDEQEIEVETLQPDTPRSQSAAASSVGAMRPSARPATENAPDQ